MGKTKWETRPLDVWNKAKELRARWQKSIDTASEEKMLLAQGNCTWSNGYVNLRVIEDNPVGAMMASKSSEYSRVCRLAGEVEGWGREVCGYQLNCWGAMYLGHQQDGSPFPMRDMVVPMPDPCDQHTKRGQAPMDYSPIPRWQGNYGMYTGPYDPKREEAMIYDKVQNILQNIEDVERIFGQKFDDEALIENGKLIRKIHPYGQDICRFQQHIPAPLSQKDIYSFYTLGGLTKMDPEQTQEVVDLWKSLRDEVEWRVKNNIAAVGNERYRWMETHPPPWHFLKYYRYMEKYGAVCIGSQYSHMMGGAFEFKEDGTWAPSDFTFLGVPEDKTYTNREQVIRAMVGKNVRGVGFKTDEIIRPYSLNDFAKAYKVNGAILPLWRGGVGCTVTRKEQALRLSEMGVRVMHYEGSQPGDRTDLDENRFLDQLDIWMESQGLQKLED
jgi:benzoyl-CoA reductase subunit B